MNTNTIKTFEPNNYIDHYKKAISELIATLDLIDHFEIDSENVKDFIVLHGLTLYTRDTVKSALVLLDADMSASAAALVRIALEHAGLIQWLTFKKNRFNEYIIEQNVQSLNFKKIVEKCGIIVPQEYIDYYKQFENVKKNQAIRTNEILKSIDSTQKLYMSYRELCSFVHPSASTGSRYLFEDYSKSDVVNIKTFSDTIDFRPYIRILAFSLSLAVAPYVNIIKTKPFKKQMQDISEKYQLPLWATSDGKPPKTYNSKLN